MALIEWKESYIIGIPAIDYDHEHLISAINELAELAVARSTPGEVLNALGRIQILSEAHFALEEKVMRDFDYPDYAPHRADHELLLSQLDDIMDAIDDADLGGDEPPLDVGGTLADRMGTWFTVHFADHDRKLHTLVQQADSR